MLRKSLSGRWTIFPFLNSFSRTTISVVMNLVSELCATLILILCVPSDSFLAGTITNENVAILYSVFDRIMFSDHNPTIFRPLYSVKSDIMICFNSLIWATNRYKKSSIVNVTC